MRKLKRRAWRGGWKGSEKKGEKESRWENKIYRKKIKVFMKLRKREENNIVMIELLILKKVFC